ncbi:TerC family protein [Cytophagales bacterium LB-30]|uniref:TerC family protein n=1 Tax=Shiella aurantiaca TaxID=3058365 RepID=A0ABT8F175_9BACT|nr:TerC family protein [Shiella aurantiaca]MDN4164054.1 TerC family protein [Shiella aurantiaca]
MEASTLWIGFNAFIVVMLIIDLGIFHKKSHEVSVKEALTWTGVWVALAFLFNVFIYYYFGEERAYEFLTGYVIEKSLSVDNIFVMVLIFSYFNVPNKFQHKVLFWGILGAIIMRVIFILSGVELIQNFHWLIYLFGGFLIYTGIKIFFSNGEQVEMEKNVVVRLARKIFRITPDFEEDKFFVRKKGVLWVTPLFVVVLVVEFTDLIFAVDSIPAILSITNDTFIVYTSNVFAILGLRSLYFALAGIEKYFTYLKYGLSIILTFVGVKMCISEIYKIPVELSLGFIVLTLSFTVLASMVLQASKKTD